MSALRRAVPLGFALLLASPAIFAEDLLSVYQQAVQSDPRLAEARANLQAAEQNKPLARSAYLPHLGLGASVGFNSGSFSGFAGLNISKAYLSNSYSVSLTQAVFNGAALSAMKEAGSQIQAAAAGLAYTEQDLALRVAKAYFAVLEAQAQQAIAGKQTKLLESIYKQTQAQLQIGTGDIISVREARARLDAAKADLIQAENATQIARQRLERLTHQPLGPLAPLHEFQALGPQPDNMQDWVATAMKSSPQILQAEAQTQSAQDAVEVQRRARWPKLDLQGIAQHVHGNPFPGFTENQAGVSLNLSMPLFEGGQISSQVQKAEAQSMASSDHLGSVRDAVKLDVESAFLDLQNSVAQLQAAKESAQSAKVSLEGTRKGYEVGTRSIIDLLQTATDYIRAEQQYNVALYRQVTARVALKAAAGQLNIGDLTSINALLQP
ncbi:TolC family outer membrane protein [Acidithiobacillus sp. AMEEHan]|uniref:TolC family outer membrane protein n=1 Tax=Acidithiobacillus sp. AMEEHan TaxID=2994951 RepID=UPI0027E4FC30|nr:TolC family outer membrane protein [Acidithiobacillus sp. AMEEHan]